MRRSAVNAERFRGVLGDLEPLVAAGRAEGWAFVGKLVGELSAGDFARPGAALFGVYEGARPGADLWGVCGLVRDPYLAAQPEVGRLRHLYVLPEYRGQGLGRWLMTRLEAGAIQHNIPELRLTLPDAQADLLPYYARMGYRAREPQTPLTLHKRVGGVWQRQA